MLSPVVTETSRYLTVNYYNCYLSSDEGEVKEELEEPFIMENGYEGDLPSPVIPSSLLEEQVKLFKKTAL